MRTGNCGRWPWLPRFSAMKELDRWPFAAVVLVGLAAGIWMAAAGLDRLSLVYHRLLSNSARAVASSPVPYRTALRSTAALLAATQAEGGGWRMAIRVDSVPNALELRRICALASRPENNPEISLVALSGDLPRCEGGAVVRDPRLVIPHEATVRAALRTEWAGARWVVLDAGTPAGTVMYTARATPSRAELAAFAAMLATDAGRVRR